MVVKQNLYTIFSPYRGIIESIKVNENSNVYEWEQLFEIRLQSGITKEISVGMSGKISCINVKPGQEVNDGAELCKVEDDFIITGCD